MLVSGPSAHLSWMELRCRDEVGTPYPGAWLDRALALASEFEALRETCSEELGRPARIVVISAYRTPVRNAEVGGAGKGQHPLGRALDLAPPLGMELARFHEIVLAQADRRGIIRGVGLYPRDGHLHLDIRPSTGLARWEE